MSFLICSLAFSTSQSFPYKIGYKHFTGIAEYYFAIVVRQIINYEVETEFKR